MSFDKCYPNRKDKRKPYHKSKAVDRACRSHGGCPWCENGRLHTNKRREPILEGPQGEIHFKPKEDE